MKRIREADTDEGEAEMTENLIIWGAFDEQEYDCDDRAMDYYQSLESAQKECAEAFTRTANRHLEYKESHKQRQVMATLGVPCKPVERWDLSRTEWRRHYRNSDSRLDLYVWSNITDEMQQTRYYAEELEIQP
jgi:hypothetical protein